MKYMVILLFILLFSCNNEKHNTKPAVNCVQQLSGFQNLNDPKFKIGTDDYITNTVKISKHGALSWNGIDMTTMHNDGLPVIETFLTQVKSFEPRPLTILDFDAGAPCGKISAVRNLMIKHLGCGPKDLCLQGNWEARFGVVY